MTNQKEKIVALYVRVSTGYQVDKDSLPFQKKELKAYCEHVLHVDKKRIEVFEDAGKSGKNTKRPAFERMMEKVKAGKVSHVVVYKIDRITRNLVDFSLMYDDFKYNNVTFISLNEQFDTSSAIGEAILKIILVFAELERKLTSERVTDVMIGRAQSGQWNGARVPYGWDWDAENKCPVHSKKEAPYAKAMYQMYLDGGSSVTIRDYNNSHNIPTKRGGEWTSKTVADFLRNPIKGITGIITVRVPEERRNLMMRSSISKMSSRRSLIPKYGMKLTGGWTQTVKVGTLLPFIRFEKDAMCLPG